MTTYTVMLPPGGLVGRPLVAPIKTFKHHDTFAAYLAVWAALGYSVTWPATGLDAVIGGRV